MNLIVKVSSETPRAPLLQLLRVPLGLDVWEVKPDYLVLRANEAQVHRLEQIGYRVAQLHETSTFLSTFATAEALAGYHSVQTLEQELKGHRPQRRRAHDLGTAHRRAKRQCPQTSIHGLSSCPGMDRGRSALSTSRPSDQKRQPGSNQTMAQPGRDLGCAHG